MERRHASSADLLELTRTELAAIRRLARDGQEAITHGRATTGSYALRKIEERALDAERIARGEVQARCMA